MLAATVCASARAPSNEARRTNALRRGKHAARPVRRRPTGTTQSPTATSAPRLRTRSGRRLPPGPEPSRSDDQPRSMRRTRPGAHTGGRARADHASSRAASQPRARRSSGTAATVRTPSRAVNGLSPPAQPRRCPKAREPARPWCRSLTARHADPEQISVTNVAGSPPDEAVISGVACSLTSSGRTPTLDAADCPVTPTPPGVPIHADRRKWPGPVTG